MSQRLSLKERVTIYREISPERGMPCRKNNDRGLSRRDEKRRKKGRKIKDEPSDEKERNDGIGAKTGFLIGGFEFTDTLKMFSAPIDIINTLYEFTSGL